VKRFAFITHLPGTDSSINSFFYPLVGVVEKIIPRRYFKNLISFLPPYKMAYVDGILSSASKRTAGWFITAPLMPEHFAGLSEETIVNKIVDCCNLAEKLGADIVGLAGFTSIIGNQGEAVSRRIKVAVTSGNSYTAFLAIDSLLKAAECLNMNLSNSSLCVIGGGGDIGRICCKFLSRLFAKIVLVGRDLPPLEDFAKSLGLGNHVSVSRDIKSNIWEADFVLCVSSNILPLFEVSDLRPGTVVCDVSMPPSILKNKANFRRDVLIFEGGKAKVSFHNLRENTMWKRIFPDNVIFGCLAETILLSLEEKIESFSLGRGNITPERMQLISKLAKKHGAKTAYFKFGDYYYLEEDFNVIKKARYARHE